MAQTEIFKNSKAQSNKRILGLAVFITAINVLLHFGLWYFQSWSPLALVSLSLFFLVLFQYKKEHRLLLTQKNAQIIQLLTSSGFSAATHHIKQKVFQKDFIRSRLYDDLPFIYKGDNLLKTENWFMSNITVSKKLPKNKEAIIVFDGVFAKFKNQLSVNGAVAIKPQIIGDKTEIPEVLQNLMHRYFTPTVLNTFTGNKVFDKRFEVFSYPPELQTKVLTLSIINSILEIESKLNNCFNFGGNASDSYKNRKSALEISFVEGYIYIGIRGLKLFNSNENYNSICEPDKFQECIELFEMINQISLVPKTIK